MPPPVVCLDVDEVLADFLGGLRRMLKHVTGHDMSGQIFHTWDLVASTGLSVVDLDRVMTRIRSTNFWETLEVVHANVDAMDRLGDWWRDGRIDLWFLTNRPASHEGVTPTSEQTADWLDRHGFTAPRVVLIDEKGPLARALNANYFYDDRFENCQDVKTHAPNAVVMMQAMPHNASFRRNADDLSIRVVSSLDALVDELRFVHGLP